MGDSRAAPDPGMSAGDSVSLSGRRAGGPGGQARPAGTQPVEAQRPRPAGLHIEYTTRGVKWLLSARLAVTLLILAFILISEGGWGEALETRIVYAVVTGMLAVNAAYLLILRKIRSLDTFAQFQIAVDIAVEAVLVFLTGGVTSQIVVLFMLSIMSASLVLSWRAAVVFTAEATVLHVMATALYAGLVTAAAPGVREILSRLFLQIPAFFAVALLSGLLAARLVAARLLSRDILEAIGQGLIVADGRGRILFSNDEAKRMLGEEAVASGRTLDEALPPQAREAFEEDPLTRGALAREVEFVLPDGSTAPASFAVQPVLAEGDRQVGALVVITDRSLERRVEEAMMQAERSEAVSEMSTAIAHEIRNPLAAMRSSVQEVARKLGQLPEDSKVLFDIVLSESDRLDAIISDFLAFAKMRPVRKVNCDIAQVVEEAAVIFRRSIEPAGSAEVVTELDGTLRCRADAQQIRQALLNLGLNSLDAVRDRPGGRIVLRVRPCALLDFPLGEAEGQEAMRARALGERAGVQIDVEDDGCGMSEDARRRALDPFFTQKECGTGLGLAVVARIIKSHGGLIRIESTEGQGTSFHIWLPSEE